MKCIVFLTLAGLAITAVSSEKMVSWGNINAREIGTENVVVPSTMFQVKTYNINFPKVIYKDWMSPLILKFHHFAKVFLKKKQMTSVLHFSKL